MGDAGRRGISAAVEKCEEKRKPEAFFALPQGGRRPLRCIRGFTHRLMAPLKGELSAARLTDEVKKRHDARHILIRKF